MQKYNVFLVALILLVIILYPKFPLLGVSGTFVSVRLEDFIVAAITAWWALSSLRKIQKISTLPVQRSIILYWLVGFVGLFSGIVLTKTVIATQGFLHFFRRIEYMIMFFAAYDFMSSKLQLKFIIRCFLTISLLVALYGLGQQFMNFPIISTTNSEFAKGLAVSLGAGARINSTFAGHYDLAAFCVFPILLILGLLSLPIKQKPLLAIIGLLVYWSMLLSASRTTFISLFVASSLLVWFIRKKNWLIPICILATAGVIFTPQLRGRYLEFITTRFHLSLVQVAKAQTIGPVSKDVNSVPDALKPASQPEDRSFSIRINASWPKAIRAFEQNPILGTGFSSVGLAVDSDILRIFAETGILGFAAFTLIFLRFFKTSLPYFLKYKPSLESIFILSFSCYLLSLFANAVFIDIFEASKVAIITWTIMGITEKLKTFA
jgi:hypothetical protein